MLNMKKAVWSLSKKMELIVPAGLGACGTFAKDELVRLLAKLGTQADISETGKTLTFSLVVPGSPAGKIPAAKIKKIKIDGFVSDITGNGVTLAAQTEKGLLNAVYTLIEDLGIIYLMPGEKNEYVSPDAPFALECGTQVRNMLCNYSGVTCEYAAVTEKDHTGEEWMEYFCKIRYNFIARHAGGKVENDPKYGFVFGHGGHEFHHLLPKEFKAEHPETCRQIQPDDFLGERVNDVNFCYSSEEAWIEIEKNFAKHLDEFKNYDHLVLEFADLPGGGHCLCANCRHYTASDVQAIVMNRFAEIIEKLGLNAAVQMNAYHDTMMPSVMFPPRKNIRIAFAPRERCWAHALNDPACERNKFYLDCLKAWSKHAFAHTDYRMATGYYTDQILFRGLYPFTPDVIAEDSKCFCENGINELFTLQVGGQILQPDYNLIFHAAFPWDPTLTGKSFCRKFARKLGGKEFAPVIEKYLLARAKCFTEVLKWCEVDKDVCHLDYRWLKEDESPFFQKMVMRLHKTSETMAKIAAELKAGIKKAPAALKKLLTDEADRAIFESGVLEGMSLQQKVFCKLPAARRTRDLKLVKECRNELLALDKFLRNSIKAGDKVGLGKNAYYGRFVDPWLSQDIVKKVAWCDSILKRVKKK